MWKCGILAGLAIASMSFACEGPAGPPGPDALKGSGGAGPPGPAGSTGPQGLAADASVARQHATTGPGLNLAITSASIDAGGAVTVAFTVTDGSGIPLDLSGTYTDGAVSPRFVLSWLGQDSSGSPLEYTAYTLQSHSSVDASASAPLPDSDTGGMLSEVGVGEGTYTYVLGTHLPSGFDVTKTHTVGAWATRTFGGQTYVVNTLYNFVPNGSPVTVVRDIVTTTACNRCHNPLEYHEGGIARRGVGLCVLCHSAQATDVSNGQSLDMSVMVHKIHMGKNLPSVLAGTPYQLTGDNGAYVDHSGAWFPGDIRNCAVCHAGSQGTVWQTTAPRAACGGCHDDISFDLPVPAGMKLHSAGVQKDDSQCTICHQPTGSKFAIAEAHATASTAAQAPRLALAIGAVDRTQPGQTPVLHFSVTENDQPLDILATPLPSLAVTLAGPTTDYASASPTLYVIQGTGAIGTLALDGTAGSYAYTFPAPIPATATGTYAVGMEGYVEPDTMTGLRYAALNPVSYVAVTDAAPVPRRQVVDRDKCDSCHVDLSAHGGTRKSPEYCVLCHTPNAVDDQQVARLEVPMTTAPSINFKVLVHKIHRGAQLSQGYVVGGDPGPTSSNPSGTPVDFGAVRYPGNQRACWACHAGTSYQLPLPAGLLPTKTEQVLACADPALDATTYCSNRTVQSESYLQPAGAACTACHDQPFNVAHAEVMTASDGTESCPTCHGPGAQFDVQSVHVLPP